MPPSKGKSKVIITTKTGDHGSSSLYSGERVPKSSIRLHALGDLDELGSILGLARAFAKKRRIKKELLILQRELHRVNAEVATTKKALSKLVHRVDQKFLDSLDDRREKLYEYTALPSGFIVPGSTKASAYLDFARTVARRCERRIVDMYRKKETTNKVLLVWINRLSDYLYLMARHEEDKPTLVKE